MSLAMGCAEWAFSLGIRKCHVHLHGQEANLRLTNLGAFGTLSKPNWDLTPDELEGMKQHVMPTVL